MPVPQEDLNEESFAQLADQIRTADSVNRIFSAVGPGAAMLSAAHPLGSPMDRRKRKKLLRKHAEQTDWTKLLRTIDVDIT